MNRFIFVIFLLLFFINLEIYSSKVVFDISGLPYKPSVKTQIQGDHFRYMVNLKMDTDGLYTLYAPPFPVISEGPFTAGELRFSDIAALMFNPTSTDNKSGFFRERIQRDFSPSLNPGYSGLSFSGKSWDIFVFNPSLNSKSPSGVGGDIHIKNLGIGLAAVDFSTSHCDSIVQTEWSKKNSGAFYSILSADSQYSDRNTKFESSSFIRSSFGLSSGTSYNIGSDLSLINRNVRLKLSIRHGQDTEKPEKISASVLLSGQDNISVGAEYSSDMSGKPVYGGESQQKTVRIGFQGSWHRISVKNISQIKYTKSGTSNTKTDYRLSYRGSAFALNAKASHNRQKNTLDTWSVEFEDRNCSLSLKNGKMYLTYRFSFVIGELKLKVTINQLSQITLFAGISN